jgi:hypothetical protein
VAMSFLLDLKSRARTIAASMAIDGPETLGGAPMPGVPSSLGQAWGLTAKEELSCPARNDGAAGRGRKL